MLSETGSTLSRGALPDLDSLIHLLTYFTHEMVFGCGPDDWGPDNYCRQRPMSTPPRPRAPSPLTADLE